MTLYDSFISILKQIYAYNDNILFLIIGSYSQDDVDNLLVESLKMKQLNHSNVMTLEGVCVDAGPAPFIVLPYMAGMCYFSYAIYIQFRKKLMDTYEAFIPIDCCPVIHIYI